VSERWVEPFDKLDKVRLHFIANGGARVGDTFTIDEKRYRVTSVTRRGHFEFEEIK
jgi:hypothetical protein